MTGDGFVGVDDLNRTIENWNKGRLPVAVATVPEPTGIACFLLLPALRLTRRRRKAERARANAEAVPATA